MSLKRLLTAGVGLVAAAGAVAAVRRSFAANPFAAYDALHRELFEYDDLDGWAAEGEEAVRVFRTPSQPGAAPGNLTVAEAEAVMAKSGLTLAVTKQGQHLVVVEDVTDEAQVTAERAVTRKATKPAATRSKATEEKAALKAAADARKGLCGGTTKAGKPCAKKAVSEGRCAQHPVPVNA